MKKKKLILTMARKIESQKNEIEDLKARLSLWRLDKDTFQRNEERIFERDKVSKSIISRYDQWLMADTFGIDPATGSVLWEKEKS